MQLCKRGVNLYISDATWLRKLHGRLLNVADTNMNALGQKVVVKKRDDDIGGGH